MPLTAGTRLGPYAILAPLGAGGMGEVYKAKDTRLDRTVAVKVLPSHMSASADVRQRFEREAKTISQLSHPHICALYDVGREADTEYLVMEYLEGETLSDRLAKGPLPLEQTLRYGVEIADAQEPRAHSQSGRGGEVLELEQAAGPLGKARPDHGEKRAGVAALRFDLRCQPRSDAAGFRLEAPPPTARLIGAGGRHLREIHPAARSVQAAGHEVPSS